MKVILLLIAALLLLIGIVLPFIGVYLYTVLELTGDSGPALGVGVAFGCIAAVGGAWMCFDGITD